MKEGRKNKEAHNKYRKYTGQGKAKDEVEEENKVREKEGNRDVRKNMNQEL